MFAQTSDQLASLDAIQGLPAPDQKKTQKSRGTRPKRKNAYCEAVAIQKLIASDAKQGDCEPKVRCLLARAFKELEELKLRLRMKPAPKPVDVAALDLAKRKRSAPAKGFTETPAEQKVKPAAKPEPGPETT